jgi:TPR repeat protein
LGVDAEVRVETAMLRNVVTLALLALCLSAAAARAQSKADDAPVTDCDKYAANSLDPQRKAPGVTLVALNAALAMPACEAAVQKYPDSARFMYQLGRAHHKSDNFATAALWYKTAMQHGSGFGEAAYGLMLMDGQGVQKDIAKAVPLFRDAADKGVVIAQNALGYLYGQGIGLPKDTALSLAWYRKAAEQGAPNAQLNLGIAYEEGNGVKQDLAQAAMWYRKAAAFGIGEAKKRLGALEAKMKSLSK